MSNKLIEEESPYLKQHSQNPVDWYPWGEEALNLAKEQDKPIFLSIGYSSCHWCHVMEKESFENEEIARVLNENFISIKVDKEERPDIDKHFQNIYQKMNNKGGGWPLSIFINNDKLPIYSGTYIPPIANYGKMGFKELLEIIAKSWNKDKATLIAKGEDVIKALAPSNKIEATKIDEQLESIVTSQIKQVFDKAYGGFGKAPKFPHASTLYLAINLYKLNKDSELKEIVIDTLNKMSLGGIYDIVEGGFCRYSTDTMWLVPHFEKMTYDNALLVQVYTKAYMVFGIDRFKDIAIETVEFMLKKMNNNLLFFSASDADTNGVEGDYFIYDYSEVKEAFEKNKIDSRWLFELSITRNGNFDGKSIARFNTKESIYDKDAKKALDILRELREGREYPFIDNKIITSWNSMMITSLFKLSKVDKRYLESAKISLKSLKNKMVNGVDIYHSALIENSPKVKGFLEDYAYYTEALIEAYNSTLDEIYLIEATSIANEAIKRFFKDGRWIIGDSEFKDYDDDYDTSYPSSISIMVDNLLTLRSLSEPIYEKFIFNTMQVHSYNLMRQPISRPTLTNCAIRYLRDDKVVKSNEGNLKEIVDLEFKYPYTFLKVTNDSNYLLCDNSSCYEKFDKKDDLTSSL